jgi:hypothetical protein
MSIFDKMQNLDVRLIYLLAWIFVLAPLLSPMGLPVTIGNDSTKWNKYVSEVKDGSVVILAPMYGASGIPELMPMTVATMHHLWQKNVKVIILSFWVDGPLVTNIALQQANPESYGKKYGVDWINLGYVPGQETAMSTVAKDIIQACPKDYVNNKPVSEYPIMAGIKDASNIDLIISIETGTPGLPEWLRQWQEPFKNKIIVGCIGVSVPGMAPYLNSGQLGALMPGLTSSAEYEKILGKPGLGLASTDAVSMSHVLVLLLVLLGNVGYFASKMGGKK